MPGARRVAASATRGKHASSAGKARATPMPRRNCRRGTDQWRFMSAAPRFCGFRVGTIAGMAVAASFLERGTLDDAVNDFTQIAAVVFERFGEGIDGRRIIILD